MLGITQGLTEFAPVSSSGHLILVPWLFHWSILNDTTLNKTFDVALHVGTFVGAAVYFRQDIAKYVRAWVRSIRRRSTETVDERLAWYIVAATVPGAVAGAVLEEPIDRVLGQPWLIGIMLAVFGVLLYVVDRRSTQTKRIEDLRFRQAFFIGLAQAVALQPGVSRSGVTITAARGVQLTREAAARFSFLLSLPIIGGAAIYKGSKILTGSEHIPPGFTGPFVWGMVASAVSGFLVIWGLLAYLRRRSFAPFVLYRLAASVFVLSLIVTGVRSATVG
ncbi:MAG TPA: undecaprenyl-diphosphate phosphatase [Actinomycetota bacterium]|nr:undecaprenyl-diphosphate phosphatase [Actinomycetota bacterium]